MNKKMHKLYNISLLHKKDLSNLDHIFSKLPSDLIRYINEYLDIRCHVCQCKIDLTESNIHIQQFVYCSEHCYEFV